MKGKILLAIAFVFTASFSLKAQGLKFGIKAGADINKITGKSFSQEFSYGYQAGVFSEIGLTQKFGLQPEVIFSQTNIDTATGFKEIVGFNNIDKVKLSYVKIPILLTYKPNPFMVLQLGPEFGRLIDKGQSIGQNGKSIFSDGDLSMVGGLQVNITKVRVYGRYAVGLNNINETTSPEKWKSRSVQIGLGLTL